MEYTIALSDIAEESARQSILKPLAEYSNSAGPSGSRPLVIEIRSKHGSVLGGFWGTTAYGWLFAQWLVVPEPLRGTGLSRTMMDLAERESIERGCVAAWLDTFEFQARGFYEKLGYVCFGELENYPSGFSRFFMKKRFAAKG